MILESFPNLHDSMVLFYEPVLSLLVPVPNLSWSTHASPAQFHTPLHCLWAAPCGLSWKNTTGTFPRGHAPCWGDVSWWWRASWGLPSCGTGNGCPPLHPRARQTAAPSTSGFGKTCVTPPVGFDLYHSSCAWRSLCTYIFQRAFPCNRVWEHEFKSIINFPLSSKHLFHHFKWFLNGCNALDLPAEITSVLSSKSEFLSPLALCSLQIIQWEFIW